MLITDLRRVTDELLVTLPGDAELRAIVAGHVPLPTDAGGSTLNAWMDKIQRRDRKGATSLEDATLRLSSAMEFITSIGERSGVFPVDASTTRDTFIAIAEDIVDASKFRQHWNQEPEDMERLTDVARIELKKQFVDAVNTSIGGVEQSFRGSHSEKTILLFLESIEVAKTQLVDDQRDTNNDMRVIGRINKASIQTAAFVVENRERFLEAVEANHWWGEQFAEKLIDVGLTLGQDNYQDLRSLDEDVSPSGPAGPLL